jgi:hypothetical protein
MSSKMMDIFKSSGSPTFQLYAALDNSLLVN